MLIWIWIVLNLTSASAWPSVSLLILSAAQTSEIDGHVMSIEDIYVCALKHPCIEINSIQMNSWNSMMFRGFINSNYISIKCSMTTQLLWMFRSASSWHRMSQSLEKNHTLFFTRFVCQLNTIPYQHWQLLPMPLPIVIMDCILLNIMCSTKCILFVNIDRNAIIEHTLFSYVCILE